MRHIVLLFTIFLTTQLSGQSIFKETQVGCDLDMFHLESDTLLTTYKTIDSLAMDFYKGLNPKFRETLKGVIAIQIYVDMGGSPCCVSIQNDSNITSRKLGIKDAINSLGSWSVPVYDLKPANVCAIVRLTFSESQIFIERVGFNYFTKFKTITKSTIDR